MTPLVQRQAEEKEEEETIQTKLIAEQVTPLVQRQVEEGEEEEEIRAKMSKDAQFQRQEAEPEEKEEDAIQTKRADTKNPEVGLSFEKKIRSLKNGGQPLLESTRKFFEPKFGHDLSPVRLHTDNQAASLAQTIKAKAFAVGKDLFFGAGEYSPDTTQGKKLLAHELIHVMQQKSFLSHITRTIQRKTASKQSRKVIGHGASAAAISKANERMTEVLGSLQAPSTGTLKGMTVELHIIPHNKKLTNLSEFASLKGKKTFDGRNYDDLRGVGGMKIGTTIRYAVAEEQLVSIPGKPSGYALGFTVAHESGHIVEQFGLTKDQKKELQKAYEVRKKATGPWLNPDWYTSSGTGEYFAQSTAAYFGRPYSTSVADKKTYTRGWLKKNDPAMYKLLSAIYK